MVVIGKTRKVFALQAEKETAPFFSSETYNMNQIFHSRSQLTSHMPKAIQLSNRKSHASSYCNNFFQLNNIISGVWNHMSNARQIWNRKSFASRYVNNKIISTSCFMIFTFSRSHELPRDHVYKVISNCNRKHSRYWVQKLLTFNIIQSPYLLRLRWLTNMMSSWFTNNNFWMKLFRSHCMNERQSNFANGWQTSR